jgi:hypothetical protein
MRLLHRRSHPATDRRGGGNWRLMLFYVLGYMAAKALAI